MSSKVALIVTVPIVLFMAFHFQEHAREDRRLLYHNAEMQLQRSAEMMKEEADSYIAKKDLPGLQALVERISKSDDFELIMLYDHRGAVISCNKTQLINRDLREIFSEELSAKSSRAVTKALQGGYSSYFDEDAFQYCLVMPIKFSGENTGALYMSLDLKGTQAEVRKRAKAILVDSVLILAVTIGVLYVLFHYLITRRLRAVSAAAIKFASGDMRVRTKVGGTDEIAYLAASFDLLADEITNWRKNLEEMVAGRVKELSALYEVVDTISKSLELDKVLPNVLDRVLENTGEGKGVVVLVSDKGDTLKVVAQRGMLPDSLLQISAQGQGCVGDVILKNDVIRISGEDDEEGTQFPGLEAEGLQSALVVPISVRGAVLGVIAVYSVRKNRFSDQEEALLTTVGSQVGVAVENARLYEKTLELAQKDGLTGLPNRRYLMERLKQEVAVADRYHTSLSVMILDLDKFKTFNDTYGHLKGDELLKAFSVMLMSAVRAADITGRYGGEEFCVVLPNTSIKGALVIAERIRETMETTKIPIGSEQPPAGRTLSIGVAEFTQGDTEEKLLSLADAALYRAKEGGRNRVAW